MIYATATEHQSQLDFGSHHLIVVASVLVPAVLCALHLSAFFHLKPLTDCFVLLPLHCNSYRPASKE